MGSCLVLAVCSQAASQVLPCWCDVISIPLLGWKIPGFGSKGQLGCSGAMAEPVPTLCCTDLASEEVLGATAWDGGMQGWWDAGVVGCRDGGPGHVLMLLQGWAWLQMLSCPSKCPLTSLVGICSRGWAEPEGPHGAVSWGWRVTGLAWRGAALC